MPSLIRTIYLYLIAAITIVMILVALTNTIKVGLEVVFNVKLWDEIGPRYECQDKISSAQLMGKPIPAIAPNETPALLTEEEKTECLKKSEELAKERATNERKRDLIWSLAMIIVAMPVYLYHWRTIQKDHKS